MTAAGASWGVAVFPLIASVVALYFGIQLVRRYVSRRREFEGIWAVALLMYAAASLAMFFGVVDGWTAAEFRTYWLLGAVLNVPFLFLGEVYLLGKRRWIAPALLALLIVGAGFAVSRIWTAPVNQGQLSRTFPLGKEVFGNGAAAYRLAQIYSFPAYFLLLGGLVWSAVTMGRVPELRARTTGVLLIAAGATVVAIGSGIGAGFRIVALFSVSLAAGVTVMFWGFLKTTGRGSISRQAAGASPQRGP